MATDPNAVVPTNLYPQAGGGSGGVLGMLSDPTALLKLALLGRLGGDANPSAPALGGRPSPGAALPAPAPRPVSSAPPVRALAPGDPTSASDVDPQSSAVTANLAADRARYAKEIADNPALGEKIQRIAYNEQGRNPQGTQAVIESMMNRASVRGTSLEQQARWHHAEPGGYYAIGNMGRGALENDKTAGILQTSLSNALGGSNLAAFATDNSSGSLARHEASTGAFNPTASFTGETFFAPGSAEPGFVPKHASWRDRMALGVPAGTILSRDLPPPPGAADVGYRAPSPTMPVILPAGATAAVSTAPPSTTGAATKSDPWAALDAARKGETAGPATPGPAAADPWGKLDAERGKAAGGAPASEGGESIGAQLMHGVAAVPGAINAWGERFARDHPQWAAESRRNFDRYGGGADVMNPQGIHDAPLVTLGGAAAPVAPAAGIPLTSALGKKALAAGSYLGGGYGAYELFRMLGHLFE